MTKIIEIENLSKKYVIRHQKQNSNTMLRDVVTEWTKKGCYKLFHPIKTQYETGKKEELWALNDINLSVNRGDKVGIIGQNGAGKSTLLKVLSRITEPTTGKIKINGKVASLLEVGTGFHPELTGRENIFLNGAVLGMNRIEILKRVDDIVSFAGIEKFLDTPVKRYSSGMYVRLAFAVAAQLEQEVLLVDEVLAVGDAAFQKKCLGKMDEISQKGRTIIFVSHNMQAVQTLCNKCIFMDSGKIVDYGDTSSIVSQYLKNVSKVVLEKKWDNKENAPGTDKIRVNKVSLIPKNNDNTDEVTVKSSFDIEIFYWNLIHDTKLNVTLLLYNIEGICVFMTASTRESKWHGRPFPKGLFKSTCHIPSNLLNNGSYRASIIFVKDTTVPLFSYEDALTFDVNDVPDRGSGDWHGKWLGAVRPNLLWSTEEYSNKSNQGYSK